MCIQTFCMCCTKERSRQITAKQVFVLVIKNLIIFEFFCRVSSYLVVNTGFSLSFGDFAFQCRYVDVDYHCTFESLGVLDYVN